MNPRTLKIVVEYEGTRYAGWQRQKNALTIQQVLEEALGRVLQEQINLTGAGRTDAGVHATGQVAHFKTSSALPLTNILNGANSLLPEDVAILSIEEVDDSFNARRNARLRWYRYQIINRKVPIALFRQYYWHIPYQLNLERMERIAEMLRGTHDFRAFRSQLCSARRTVLTMKELSISRNEDTILIDFKCRSFLHNMVRIIVGLMVAVGRGKLPVRVCEEMLLSGKRNPEVPTAPAQGLILMKVFYSSQEEKNV
ncbi:tRNA pseudouridine(38-40) synthase TruA [Candidatus Sumerlaeota bacterium]|nr:tRNA pseudouridine(38-40) synthase TruA [Candidatus Sumerlaeota bacterium]